MICRPSYSYHKWGKSVVGLKFTEETVKITYESVLIKNRNVYVPQIRLQQYKLGFGIQTSELEFPRTKT